MAMNLGPMLAGQGTYGPLRVPGLRGPMHFWSSHHSMPPAQNSVIVYKDGSVLEGSEFSFDDLTDPEVHRYFIGGYQHRCDPESDPLSYNALMGAGYTCWLPTVDVYQAPEDVYTDEYPQADTAALRAVMAAEAEAARVARIAELRTELAVLEGTTP